MFSGQDPQKFSRVRV